jgi:mannose-6-phosphate isomerase-like protein (cupin superfamily)
MAETLEEAGDCPAFVLDTSFVHLDDKGGAFLLPVDAGFWETPDPRLDEGRMVSIFTSESDWPNWEMHPEGDELVYLLSGRMTLILEGKDAPHRGVDLVVGQGVLVPRGTWHTADVAEPGKALFITPGKGTQGRPRTC